jgi:hypothetical protein
MGILISNKNNNKNAFPSVFTEEIPKNSALKNMN